MDHRLKKRQEHLELGSVFDNNSSLEASETVPDESMTIPYILARYTKGMPLGVERMASDFTSDNPDMPDWEKVKYMDQVDLDELSESLSEIEKAEAYQKRQRELKAKRKAKEKAQAEANKHSEKGQNPSTSNPPPSPPTQKQS